MRFAGFLLVPMCLFVLVESSRAQNDRKSLPTDDEIKLVVLQTERAIRLYKPLIEEQAAKLGGEEIVSDDRKTVSDASALLGTINAAPQSFNGPDGFALIEMIRALEHSGASCSAAAVTTALNRNAAAQKARLSA